MPDKYMESQLTVALAFLVWLVLYVVEYINRHLRKEFQREMQGLLQPISSFCDTGNNQCHDGECITEMRNGNRIGIVIELCFEVRTLCVF